MSRPRSLISCICILCITTFPTHSKLQIDSVPNPDWEFFLGNLQFTLLHELGHALLAESNIPLLGSVENAADEIATMVFTLSDIDDPHANGKKRLLAAADGWLLEWMLEQQAGSEIPYWDERPLKIQRFYRIVCMIYGSDPNTYADQNWRLRLPYERSVSCVDDYQRAKTSIIRLKENQKAIAATVANVKNERVRLIFEAPTTPQREWIAELLRLSGIVEKTVSTFKKLFPLQSNLNVVVANGCEATAYWKQDLNEIIVCYSLVEQFLYLARFRECVSFRTNSTPIPRPPDPASVNQCLKSRGRDVWMPHWPVPTI